MVVGEMQWFSDVRVPLRRQNQYLWQRDEYLVIALHKDHCRDVSAAYQVEMMKDILISPGER
jgi:hypothetical protein